MHLPVLLIDKSLISIKFSKKNWTMRLVQKNFVENALASSIVQAVGYGILFFVPKTIEMHPARSSIAIIFFTILTILKIWMVLFSKGRKIENIITFILLVLSGAFWSTLILVELLAQPTLNPSIITLLIFSSMINSIACFVLYKKPGLVITYLIVLPGFSTIYIFLFLTEMKIIFGLFTLAGTIFLFIYLRSYYQNWQNFLAEKTKSENLAKDLETQTRELTQIKTAIDNTSDAIGISTHDGKHFYQNKAFTKMFGYSVEEVNKLHPIALYSNKNEGESVFKKIMAGDECSMEIEMVSKNGHKFPVDLRANAIKNNNDEIIGLIGVHTDITERKNAEEQQQEAQDFQAQILETAATAVFTVNTEQIITSVNREFCNLTGFTKAESVGQHCHFLRWVPCSEKCSLYDTKLEGPILHKQSTIHTKDNRKLTIFKNASLIHDKKGNIKGGIESFIDVTELAEAREFAEDMNDQLEVALAKANKMTVEAEMANVAKSEFLANMSHEIRTPMNGVIGMTHLLLGTSLTQEQKEFTETIQNSGDALLNIINDILDYSKIEAGKYELENIDFDLRLTMDKLSDLIAVKAHEKRLEFICMTDHKIPSLLIGDPGRLRQILINLSGNAIKFTDKGEIVIRVSLEKEDAASVTLRFSVTDTGIGIPKDRIAAIFQSFSQADSSTTRKYGGTGLGLTISKQLAEMMDGEMKVKSEEGKGSEFWFTANFKKQTGNEAVKIIVPQNIRQKNILIVDDNDTNRFLLKEQLKLWGCRYDEASNGKQAFKKLKQADSNNDSFEIAIIDIQMPEMNGETLGKKIKQDPDIKDTTLVLMTAMGNRGDAKRFEKIGFAAYLTKPVKQSHLFDCLSLVSELKNYDNTKQIETIITRHSLAEDQKNKLRILLAEDNLINQKVALATLKKLGYKSDVAANGKEVLKALSENQYRLILMDCQMPEMDGYKATQEIRKLEDPNIKNIPIIAMTANAMEGDRKKCIEAGMDDYMTKPVKPQILSDLLEKWLLK